jgi:ubiquinone/menaquinone biosynthesis C-methylase UbiE
MDYDATAIPAVYDRARGHSREVLDTWLRSVADCAERRHISTVLDLGCGTGRFSQELAGHFQATVIGIDPSARMLQVARAKTVLPTVHYRRARSEHLPLPDRAFDLIFISMVFHHFGDRARAASECRRVLNDDGIVFVRSSTLERVDGCPYVPFFPRSLSILRRVLPSRAALCAAFEGAGMKHVRTGVVTQRIADTYAQLADKLATGADSVLAQLSAVEMNTGIAALRRHATRVDPLPVTEEIDFFAFTTEPI